MNGWFFFLFGISGGEILILLLLVLLLFGPKKIPEIARMLGRGLNEVKKVQREINTEIHRYSEDIEREAKEMDATLKQYAGTQNNDHHQKNKPAKSSNAEHKADNKATGTPDHHNDNNNNNNNRDADAETTENHKTEKPDGNESSSNNNHDDDLPYPYSRNNNEH